MKRIINSKLYNTETALKIGGWDNGYPWSDFRCEYERLYKKKTGEYFLFVEGGPLSEYRNSVSGGGWTYGEDIIPLSLDEAKEWAEEKISVQKYIEEFGVPAE